MRDHREFENRMLWRGLKLSSCAALALLFALPQWAYSQEGAADTTDTAFDIGTADRNLLPVARRFKLLFMDQYDVEDVKGWITFVSNPLTPLEQASVHPGMECLTTIPQSDGTWITYGMTFEGGESPRRPREGKEYSQVRARTKDGLNYYDREVQPWQGTGPGSGMLTQKSMAYNAAAKQFVLLYFEWWSYLSQARGYPCHSYLSNDGMTFASSGEQPAYCGNDGFHVMWDPKSKDYFSYQCLFQPWAKPEIDNAEHGRRVIGIIRSDDGKNWEPRGGLVEDQFKGHTLLTPNELDPPGTEFYWMTPFPYADRYIAQLMVYQPSPPEVNSRAPGIVAAHGPQLASEWIVSRDGLTWNRPYQHDYLGLEPNATGVFANGLPGVVQCDPIIANNRVVFISGYGVQEDRFGGVAAAGGAEFSTHLFEVPAAPLFLNATAKTAGDVDHEQTKQGYVMVEVRDEEGNIIENFEREKCYFQGVDDLLLPLKWNGRDPQELAGKKVKLHFYLRNARIYGVSTTKGVIPPGKITPVVLPKKPQVELSTRFTTVSRPRSTRDFKALAKQLQSTDIGEQQDAAWALARLNDSRALQPLIQATHDPNPKVRHTAAQALWYWKKSDVLPALFTAHAKSNATLGGLINAIRDIWREDVVLALRDLAIKSRNKDVRARAILLIADSNYRMFIPDMIQLLNDPAPDVSRAAAFALSKLTRRDGVRSREGWDKWWQDETADDPESYAVYSALIDQFLSSHASTIVVNEQTMETPMNAEDWNTLLDYVQSKLPGAGKEAVSDMKQKLWRTARLDEDDFASRVNVRTIDHAGLVEALRENGSTAALRKRFPGSNGVLRLSRVGFSPDHNRAFLFAGYMHDGKFGGATFFAFERIGNEWKLKQQLPITTLSTDPHYKMPSRYSNAF